ncbi:alpha/beta hydrolase [Spirosoma sp. BT702]|uniref:Alpha/beta hydrolase n=1 Tax=Spirosoma profusum TaxID=2771354 RepID=A0A926Y411_9BACT|nr:alpha/beta hydrolase [Spirosoma profusum]MBD2702471.1 alpha/beta hydrolase [Spirosoma profusum]
MKRVWVIIGLLIAVMAVGYMLGPMVKSDPVQDELVTVDTDLLRLEQRIGDAERAANLRPDNEARIVWADTLRKVKTPYSIIYLPGFSASWAEGDPIHKQIARHFGCNLYLARTAEHGVNSPDAMKNITPSNYAASAERALAVGKALGEKVIVMGTSAGGMLALYLAARHPEIEGLVLYSPCIAVANPALRLVTGPWGQQIIDQVFPDKHIANTYYSGQRAVYWLPKYHTNGLLTLQTMIDRYMTPEQFQKVKQPVFMGYYYKDEDNQDKVVSVEAMLTMYDQLGTSERTKQKLAFPNADAHVIASHFTSKDLPGVYRSTENFLANVMKLPAASAPSSPVVLRPKK